MKNWEWVTIFQHVKKDGPRKIMHCIRGGSWLNYSRLAIVLKTTNVSEISVMYLYVSK